MVIMEADRAVARRMFQVAVGLIAQRDPDAAALAHTALRHPVPITVRALLEAGAGKPWQQMLVEALAQVGIAAAEDVLGDDRVE